MKLISRNTAENLIRDSIPVQSQIEQSTESLKVTFTLENGKILLINYDSFIQRKSYYIIDKS
jgi:hypothetical protein